MVGIPQIPQNPGGLTTLPPADLLEDCAANQVFLNKKGSLGFFFFFEPRKVSGFRKDVRKSMFSVFTKLISQGLQEHKIQMQ